MKVTNIIYYNTRRGLGETMWAQPSWISKTYGFHGFQAPVHLKKKPNSLSTRGRMQADKKPEYVKKS